MKNEKLILIDDMEVYKMGMEIGDEVWKLVDKWDHWKKDTIGKQLVKAADSIAATFSEGYGRFTLRIGRIFVISVVVPCSRPAHGSLKRGIETLFLREFLIFSLKN